MAEESNQDKKAACTYIQSVSWHQTELIIRKIASFLGPADLGTFRLVCKKWKDESYSTWKYQRTRYILRRYSEFGLRIRDVLYNRAVPAEDIKPLTVFSGYRPLDMEYNVDCIWAEEVLEFFSRAKKNDLHLKETSFLVIKLKKWNRFGVFRTGEQTGAKWFLNEVVDKVVHLTYRCNLSISKGEFFPTLCRMTKLKILIIRGTYIQLRQSVPVHPTFAEITPLKNLEFVEIVYENCTEKKMPNYNVPWELFLGAIPELKVLMFSFSNLINLNFAIDQFTKMIISPNSSKNNILNNIVQPNQEPNMPKAKVIQMVKQSLMKKGFLSSTLHDVEQHLPPDLPVSTNFKLNNLFAYFQDQLIGIIIQDHQNLSEMLDSVLNMERFIFVFERFMQT